MEYIYNYLTYVIIISWFSFQQRNISTLPHCNLVCQIGAAPF